MQRSTCAMALCPPRAEPQLKFTAPMKKMRKALQEKRPSQTGNGNKFASELTASKRSHGGSCSPWRCQCQPRPPTPPISMLNKNRCVGLANLFPRERPRKENQQQKHFNIEIRGAGRGVKNAATYFCGFAFNLRNYFRQQYIQMVISSTRTSTQQTPSGKRTCRGFWATTRTEDSSFTPGLDRMRHDVEIAATCQGAEHSGYQGQGIIELFHGPLQCKVTPPNKKWRWQFSLATNVPSTV